MSITLDGTTEPREETRKRLPSRPRKGVARRLVARIFRIAYCATITTVTLHDADGESLVSIRLKRGDACRKTDTANHIVYLRALAISDRRELATATLHATRRSGVRIAA